MFEIKQDRSGQNGERCSAGPGIFRQWMPRYKLMPVTWRLTRLVWPMSLRRYSTSSWLSMKRFSVRTAGQLVWRRRQKEASMSGSPSVRSSRRRLVGDVDLGGVVEAGGEALGRSVFGRGVGAPAGGVIPPITFAGSVAMDGDEDDIFFAEGVAEAVDAVAVLEKADIVVSRYQEFGVEALGLEGGDYAAVKKPVFGVFQEASIGAPLSLGVHSVAVVNQDFHSWFCAQVSDCKLRIIKGKSKDLID